MSFFQQPFFDDDFHLDSYPNVSELAIPFSFGQPICENSSSKTKEIPLNQQPHSSLSLKTLSDLVFSILKQERVSTYQKVVDGVYKRCPFLRECDRNSIKRRIYDAINVMISLRVIEKQHKLLRIGNTTTKADETAQEIEECREDYIQIQSTVAQKKLLFQSLTKKKKLLEKLIERNQKIVDLEEQTIYPFPMFKLTTHLGDDEVIVSCLNNLSVVRFQSNCQIQVVGDLDILIDLEDVLEGNKNE